MKVIDLLNKIANGEEVPKKIRTVFYTAPVIYNEKQQDYSVSGRYYMFRDLFGYCKITEILNTAIEIIEEDKKIEKLKKKTASDNGVEILLNPNIEDITKKVNEIIDHINNGDDE